MHILDLESVTDIFCKLLFFKFFIKLTFYLNICASCTLTFETYHLLSELLLIKEHSFTPDVHINQLPLDKIFTWDDDGMIMG
jgi:hypothetical protein